MKLLFSLMTFAALSLSVGAQADAAPATTAAPAAKTFSAALPASKAQSLTLEFSVGQVAIKTGDTDTIKTTVRAEPGEHMHFIFNWVSGSGNGNQLPSGLHLIHEMKNGAVTLCLAISQCDDSHDFGNGWKSEWDVTVPARLHVKLQGNVGKGSVKGIAGGLEMDLNVGKISAELPCGPIKASLNVGNIKARVADADYGKVELSTNVGHVNFNVDGHSINRGTEHNFVSNSQSVQGSGNTAYAMSVNTGHIDLSLGDKDVPSNAACTTTTPPPASHAQ